MSKAIHGNGPFRGRFYFGFHYFWFLALVLLCPALAASETDADTIPDPLKFSDRPQARDIQHPDWFKQSFLDLRQDLKEAHKNNKEGLLLYFSQENCSYCKAFVDRVLGLSDIATYLQRNFDVIHLDIWGERDLIDFEGDTFTEREFSILHNTNFTPSFMFYVNNGKLALFLRGYHDPYRFRAALHYVADDVYQQSDFKDYMSRADNVAKFERGTLNQQDFFAKPPYILSRSQFPADRPLLVIFESQDCHACDLMHGETFQDQDILNRIERFEVVQLDMYGDQALITPMGGRTTARKWAHRLGVIFGPTLIFFDKRGMEIIRLDSIAKVFRMGRVLDFVLSEGFLEGNYQQWRQRIRRDQRQQSGK